MFTNVTLWFKATCRVTGLDGWLYLRPLLQLEQLYSSFWRGVQNLNVFNLPSCRVKREQKRSIWDLINCFNDSCCNSSTAEKPYRLKCILSNRFVFFDFRFGFWPKQTILQRSHKWHRLCSNVLRWNILQKYPTCEKKNNIARIWKKK